MQGDDDDSDALLEGSPRAAIDTGHVDWGEVGLAITQKVLARPELAALELFSFRAYGSRKRLVIRLDKLDDRFGSPSTADVETFARAFDAEFDAALGDFAGELEREVSSPGADRELRIPQDLMRFKELPMQVQYSAGNGEANTGRAETCVVLSLVDVDEAGGMSHWTLADVRANHQAAGKGRRLGKKKLQERISIPLQDLQRVQLYIDL